MLFSLIAGPASLITARKHHHGQISSVEPGMSHYLDLEVL